MGEWNFESSLGLRSQVLSASPAAQPMSSMQPVLFDADGKALGVAFAGGDLVISLKGYRALGGGFNACASCAPAALAFGVRRFYTSDDCTGDAVVARSTLAAITGPDSVTQTVRSGDVVIITADSQAGGDTTQAILGAIYYIPKRSPSAPSPYYAESVERNPGECRDLDPMDSADQELFGLLELVTVDLGSGPEMKFRLPSPAFAEAVLVPHDASATGFENVIYQVPVEIRWVDVAEVFTAGFELSPAGDFMD